MTTRSSSPVDYSYSESRFRKLFAETNEARFPGPGVKVHITGIQGPYADRLFADFTAVEQQFDAGKLDEDQFIEQNALILKQMINRVLLPVAKAFRSFRSTTYIEYRLDSQKRSIELCCNCHDLRMRVHSNSLVTSKEEVLWMLAQQKMAYLVLASNQRLFLTDLAYDASTKSGLQIPKEIEYGKGLGDSIMLCSNDRIKLCQTELK